MFIERGKHDMNPANELASSENEDFKNIGSEEQKSELPLDVVQLSQSRFQRDRWMNENSEARIERGEGDSSGYMPSPLPIKGNKGIFGLNFNSLIQLEAHYVFWPNIIVLVLKLKMK